jgi:hypothetical protein
MIDSYKEEQHPFGADNMPRDPAPGVMWVYMLDGKVEAVNFLCPCGCGSQCYTPVDESGPTTGRCWGFSRGQNGPTLTPSIRYLGGCKAHFNITDGKTIIHGDSGK